MLRWDQGSDELTFGLGVGVGINIGHEVVKRLELIRSNRAGLNYWWTAPGDVACHIGNIAGCPIMVGVMITSVPRDLWSPPNECNSMAS
jgi:hypothetical protein